MTAEAFAPAKINLALHVTDQRVDGYHLLDSLVVFADVGDHLWFSPANELSLEIIGPFSAGVPTDHRNLVWRAAEKCGMTGHIRLQKNLPHGGGIGGGSADAAAVLRHAFRGEERDRLAVALGLGADVPVCLSSRAQRMKGVGDVLSCAGPLPELDMVLANPRVPVPTLEVFKALESKCNAPMAEIPAGSSREEFMQWITNQRNDLQPVAAQRFPEIGQVLEALGDADLARMSGSGGTCFGLYPDSNAAAAAARRIAADHPEWWVTTTRIT